MFSQQQHYLKSQLDNEVFCQYLQQQRKSEGEQKLLGKI